MSHPIVRTALVTGAAKRIGRVIALDLARQGWSIGVHFNSSAADADRFAAEICDMGGKARVVGADLAHEDEAETLIDRAVAALGPLTCLVNNASVFENDQWETVTRESWDRHMQVNLRSPFVLIQAFARQLPAEANGVVVNILDQRVWNLTPYFMSYTVSKLALWGLTQQLA
ncbi:MAG: SDR family NAD(P)-dependent oxidoreductase, partial [Rhodospirillales bacterium]|nr:SDR family NAD(P)-dependent oxidoreductase [Rhodospirillales bacterium]